MEIKEKSKSPVRKSITELKTPPEKFSFNKGRMSVATKPLDKLSNHLVSEVHKKIGKAGSPPRIRNSLISASQVIPEKPTKKFLTRGSTTLMPSMRDALKEVKIDKINPDQKTAPDRNKIVDCPHCGRKFNFKAADSHISYCSKKAKM